MTIHITKRRMLATAFALALPAFMIASACTSEPSESEVSSELKMCPQTICECSNDSAVIYPSYDNCQAFGPCFHSCAHMSGEEQRACLDQCELLQEYEFEPGARETGDSCAGYGGYFCTKQSGTYECRDEDRPCDDDGSGSGSGSGSAS